MEGFVDVLSENIITGWAHDPDRPDESPQIQLFVGGKLVASAFANQFRPDLEAAGIGFGRRAFSLDPRKFVVADRQPARIAFARTGETLVNGRTVLMRSKVQSTEDWDKLHTHQLVATPAMDRVNQFQTGSWPRISVIIPTYNPPLEFLERAIESVRTQLYPKWELCIADDGSPHTNVRDRLKQYAAADPRILVTFMPKNGGISRATNAAVTLATGDYVAYLDHDDELTNDALAEVAALLLQEPATDVIYSDQDNCNEAGEIFDPFHKPAWSPVFFLGVMYVGHLLVARTSLVRQVGGCDSRFDKVQDFELLLRLSEATTLIRHIPKVLYHWRKLPGSLAFSPYAKDGIDSLQAAAVQASLDRRNLPLRAISHPLLPHRVQLAPAKTYDGIKVSIIIPTRDAPHHIGRCLESIFKLTTHKNFEVIAVDNGTTDPKALRILSSHPIRWLKYGAPFNFSRVNNFAVKEAAGSVLVFLNNDTRVQTPDWLQIMLAHLQIPGVGAVGPRLVYPTGSVQHAGVVLGFRGTADHVMRGFDPESDGYGGSLVCSREVSAVTAACLMMERDLFVKLGGMQEAFAMIYQDVDLCLRIREMEKSVVYVSNATLIHHESISRHTHYNHVDRELFIDRWGEQLAEGDLYYNPNFTRNYHNYSLIR